MKNRATSFSCAVLSSRYFTNNRDYSQGTAEAICFNHENEGIRVARIITELPLGKLPERLIPLTCHTLMTYGDFYIYLRGKKGGLVGALVSPPKLKFHSFHVAVSSSVSIKDGWTADRDPTAK